MAKKITFDKAYPSFDMYISDVNTRNNMLDNSDLKRKYDDNKELVENYIKELANHFDKETIRNLIIESILKLPDELMVSLIKSYLVSEESVKSNSDFFLFFKKISSFGKDSIKYIEERGLVTNRSYRQIPNIVIDLKFNKLNEKPLFFKGETVDKTFNELNYTEKEYLIKLIENESIGYLENIFETTGISLKYVVILLNSKNINPDLFLKENINGLGTKEMMSFCYLMFSTDYTAKIMECVECLLKDYRYSLLKRLINYNLILRVDEFSLDLLKELDDDVIFDSLAENGFTLKRVEE